MCITDSALRGEHYIDNEPSDLRLLSVAGHAHNSGVSPAWSAGSEPSGKIRAANRAESHPGIVLYQGCGARYGLLLLAVGPAEFAAANQHSGRPSCLLERVRAVRAGSGG